MNFVVFSHLRWDFVYQRPQHLMTLCSRSNNVFFCEEPILDSDTAYWDVTASDSGVRVAVPHLPPGLDETQMMHVQNSMVAELLNRYEIAEPVLWYYTPMALSYTSHLEGSAIVYDCMDELSAFRGAPEGLRSAESELFKRADLVFTGGQSLFEAKRSQHSWVYCFPSSIDRKFFATARRTRRDPQDQLDIPHPRLGYAGVIDERMDLDLLASIAEQRPDWHLVILGPVVKISLSDLPRRPNIHYLGGKPYRELPSYMSNWDVGLLPFAQNESTKFISPTKTPEYLAAGLPVVSTPITDVVRPYGEKGFVRIAGGRAEFVEAIQSALNEPRSAYRLKELDRFLAQSSWDDTWNQMETLIREVIASSRDVPVMSVGTSLNETKIVMTNPAFIDKE